MGEDILERAKKALIDDDMTYEDYNECISLLIAEVEAKNDKIAQNAITIQMHHNNVLTLQKDVERLRSFRGRIARILGQSPSDCDDLLIVGLDSRIILAKRLTARIKELEATKERLQSAPKSGLYGKYIIQKADGSPVDPEADYFILRLDADPVARIAALEYAIQTDDQKLGEMLEKRVMDHVFSKDDQCRKRVEGWPLGQIKRLRKEIAAKDARIADQEAYIERLEAAFLEEYQRGCVMLSPNAAKEALERIKGGRKDESI